MDRPILRLLLVLLLAPVPSYAAEPSTGGATRAVQAFVKSYVDAVNRADVTAIMEMVSKKSGVASVADGEIERGWEAIRQSNDEMVGTEGSFKVSVGSIDVLSLGASVAVAVAPLSATVTTAAGAVQAPGAITLVLEKAGGKWLIVHEHVSHTIPEPEGD